MNEIAESNIPTNIAVNVPSDSTAAAPAGRVARASVPGWQTSEFWVTALTQVGLVVAASSGTLPSKYAAMASALGQAAYSISRSIAKVGAR